VRQDERESILREDAPRAQTARERRELENLHEDLRSSPMRGTPLPLRLRNFRAEADGYLASLGGPRHYMIRLREIEEMIADHQRALQTECERLASALPPEDFAEAWRAVAEGWSFGEVNDLIERHNHWYPAESRLPMDPRRGDFVLVNGRDYRLRPLDAGWILARYPAVLGDAAAASPTRQAVRSRVAPREAATSVSAQRPAHAR
jgi:hypothetical protein